MKIKNKTFFLLMFLFSIVFTFTFTIYYITSLSANNVSILYLTVSYLLLIIFVCITMEVSLRLTVLTNKNIFKLDLDRYPTIINSLKLVENDVKIYIVGNSKSSFSNISIKGFITPHIFISKILFDNLHESELNALILHELGHIKYNHILKRGLFLYLIGVLPIIEKFFYIYSLSLDKYISPILAVTCILAFILSFTFMRKQEVQADLFAALNCGDINIYIFSLEKFFKLQGRHSNNSFISSIFSLHPRDEIRLALLKRSIH
ncbi:M48 family metalloprotease [Clostridium thermarum]|uniref:M48 family metalloprotease n=1 Tax=Clostridium thermarum TaxID=1716543 RepID=UPI0011211A1E|nr:M48 family metalloprotease [Clostridium thermarum]